MENYIKKLKWFTMGSKCNARSKKSAVSTCEQNVTAQAIADVEAAGAETVQAGEAIIAHAIASVEPERENEGEPSEFEVVDFSDAALWPNLPDPCPQCGNLECVCGPADVGASLWYPARPLPDNSSDEKEWGSPYSQRASAEEEARRRGWPFVAENVLLYETGDPTCEPQLTLYYCLGDPEPVFEEYSE